MSSVATCQVPGVGQVKLGRIIPKAVLDYGRFRVVIAPDGTQRVTPRLGFNFDSSRMAVQPPATLDYYTRAMPSIKRMYMNDTYGCCVWSSLMHQLGLFSANDSDSGGIVLATDQEVQSQYFSVCGRGDNGCVITEVLDYWKSHGAVAGGKTYKIDGYASVDNTNRQLVMATLDVFGGHKLGVDLPGAWTSGGDGSVWDVTNSGTVGGHDIPTLGYDDKGVYIATWGGMRLITWPAFTSRKYITECYVPLAPLWYGNDKLAPSGIDAATLAADLALVAGGGVPPIPDQMVDWFA